jgi:hypothetical protein
LTPLKTPTFLTIGALGGQPAYQLLLSLPRDTIGLVEHEALTKNGFEVYLLEDGNVSVAKLTAMCKLMDNYGPEDLRSVLKQMMSGNNGQMPRSDKAVAFFQNDARRLARSAWPTQQQALSSQDHERILNLLRRYEMDASQNQGHRYVYTLWPLNSQG